jgi:hypothetical protein
VTELRTKSWHRSKPFSVANIKLTEKDALKACKTLESFITPEITQTLISKFRAVRTIIMPF